MSFSGGKNFKSEITSFYPTKPTTCNNFLQGLFCKTPYQYQSIPYLRSDFYNESTLPHLPYLGTVSLSRLFLEAHASLVLALSVTPSVFCLLSSVCLSHFSRSCTSFNSLKFFKFFQVLPSPFRSFQVLSGPFKSFQVLSSPFMPFQVPLSTFKSIQVLSRPGKSCKRCKRRLRTFCRKSRYFEDILSQNPSVFN